MTDHATKFSDVIDKAAAKHGVNKELIRAVIMTESAFKPDAVRYEPTYRWVYDPERFAKKLSITTETERTLQKFSYGLMQIMGAVAREAGYGGHLFRLTRPDLGLDYGVKHLATYLKRYGDVRSAVAAYNGGPGAVKKDGGFSNLVYVEKVMSKYLV